MFEKYEFPVTLKFKTENERRAFLQFWMSGGGELMANLVTKQDANDPSWQGSHPVLYLDSIPNEEDLDIGYYDAVF